MDEKIQKWAKQAKKKGTGWPKEKLEEAKLLAEKLKGKSNIDNPHALARWMVARGAKVKKS